MNEPNSSNTPPGGTNSQTPSLRGEGRLGTARSVEDATSALQTAFERIQQVRQNIMQLTQSLPSTSDLETRFPPSSAADRGRRQQNIGPQHDALVLAGGTFEPVRSQLPARNSFSSYIRDFDGVLEGRGIRRGSSPRRPNLGTLTMPPVATPPAAPSASAGINLSESSALPVNPWVFGPSNVVPPRFSRSPRAGQLSPLSPDSAATTRGLRVAHREANPQATQSISPLNDDIEQFVTAIDNYQRVLENHLGRIGTTQRRQGPSSRPERSSNVPARTPGPTPLTTTAQNPQRYTRAHNLIYGAQQLPTTSSPAPNPSNRMNVLPRPPVPRQFEIQQPTYLPGLSDWEDGLAIRRHPHQPDSSRPVMVAARDTPSSADPAGERPLISWRFPPSHDHPPALVPRRDPLILESNPFSRVSWPSGDPNAAIPRQRTAASGTGPGRRGWARLDPDGNEIPWEDEESLERIRREHRLMALQRARQDPFSYEESRNGHQLNMGTTDVFPSRPTVPPRIAKQLPVEPPLYIDPLPMPLSAMCTRDHVQDESYPDVIVPTSACLAGR